MTGDERDRYVLRLRDYLEDEMLPDMLSPSCEGCRHFSSWREPDELGSVVAGGVPMQMQSHIDCSAVYANDCPKIQEIIAKVKDESGASLRQSAERPA